MKKLATLALLTTALISNSAFAYTDEVMDPRESYESAVTVKIARYTCLNDRKVVVKYGFNKEHQPTYSYVYLSGKLRFLPINLAKSNNMDTVFGDEQNFRVMSNAFNVYNYQKSSINIQDVNSKILFKNCSIK